MKKLLISILAVFMTYTSVFAAKYEPVPANVYLPAKYTQEYIDSISDEYKKVSKEQIFHVALDMMKGTTADCTDFSNSDGYILWSGDSRNR